jgi:peptidoglycan/LPS O-acetylase OafA/YrhL
MERRRFEALDGMRGVAALTVLIYHCDGYLGGPPLFRGGFLSVDLFFVLSGFVIALSYERRLRDGQSLFRFLQARASRLLPVHFWTMGILTFVAFTAYAAGDTRAGIGAMAISAMALMNAFFIPASEGGASPTAFPINQSLWSLWDEWVINIVYAAAMFGMRIRAIATAGVISASFAILFAWQFGGWNYGDRLFALAPSLFRALAGFAAGVLIYRAYEIGWLEKLPRAKAWSVYAAWLLICANPWTDRSLTYEIVAALVLAPSAVALLVRAERPVGACFRWLGAISYPLYASHLAVLMIIGIAGRHAGLEPNALFAFPAVVFALMLAHLVRRLGEIRFAPAIARLATRKAPATPA